MRVGIVAPPWLPCPPEGYGGTERVVALLADGLVDRGHEVTLFASGDSRTKAKLVSHFERAPGTALMVANPFAELPHVLTAYSHAEEFDVVHDHTFPFGVSIGAHIAHPPVVHTLHGPPGYPGVRPVYDLLAERISFVSISDSQRAGLPTLNYVATVYNGVAVDTYPLPGEKDGDLVFVGRMNPEKGPHLAIEVARRLGRRLLMAVKMAEPPEKEFFHREVEPLLGPNVELIGEIGFAEKVSLYSRARCTLMPIQWPEPFGLVMVESMACGTPVVAFRAGAATEIIAHGVTGFLADDLDEFAGYVARAGEIDPAACRRHVEVRFSDRAMVAGYEAVYEAVANRRQHL